MFTIIAEFEFRVGKLYHKIYLIIFLKLIIKNNLKIIISDNVGFSASDIISKFVQRVFMRMTLHLKNYFFANLLKYTEYGGLA